MLMCDIHPGVTFPEGYTCPVCQRTDANIVQLLRMVHSLEKRMTNMEKALTQTLERGA